MVVKGYVDRIRFYNESSNFGIFFFKTEDNKIITVKGTIPRIFDGKKLELDLKEELHEKYGLQYLILSAKISPITSEYELKNYLASGEFRGIGEKTAEKIVSTFGTKTLEIIKKQPELLSTIKGITLEKAKQIQIRAKTLEVYEDAYKFLLSNLITQKQANRIINIYKDQTIQIVSQNPYKLIDDVEGIGFIRADETARKIGIPINSILRLERLVVYLIDDICQKKGSTTLKYDEVKLEFLRRAGIETEKEALTLFEKTLSNLFREKELKKIEIEEEVYISNSAFYMMEKKIAEKLFSINNSIQTNVKEIDEFIHLFELKNDITMTDSQKQAVINSVNSPISIITGGPGTGKTTITKCIIEILNKNNFNVYQAAPTGRAAKRMEESTNYEAKTIHRMLGVKYDGTFIHDDSNKLQCNALIIDESSMCDTIMFYRLLRALNDEIKLIIIGDKDQLQSVSPGNILDDLINSNKFKVSYLDFIFRQKEGSEIKEIARKVNLREKVDLNKYRSLDNEVVFIEVENTEQLKEKLIALVKDEIPKRFGCPSIDIQILSPNRTFDSGSIEINKVIQENINAADENKNSIVCNNQIYRVGDKVIHTKNDYSLQWYQKYNDTQEIGEGVFNGEIGIIKEINNNKILVEYDDFKFAEYKTQEQKSNLDLAYAISIHKSQGSEFDYVIIPNILNNQITNTSKVIYTGITRAKKAVYLLTNQKIFNAALHARKAANRLTQLKWLLEDKAGEQNGNF